LRRSPVSPESFFSREGPLSQPDLRKVGWSLMIFAPSPWPGTSRLEGNSFSIQQYMDASTQLIIKLLEWTPS
jgi:hypothetical protein